MTIRRIEIVPYDSEWPSYFESEAKKLKSASGILAIHHIGSTSIPNMPAKPIIDILVELNNLDDITLFETDIVKQGYAKLRRIIIPYRSFVTSKTGSPINVNLHIYERGDPQVKRHIRFRDYLIKHINEANTYAKLKMQLAVEFKEDIFQYVLGKDKFVHTIDSLAKHTPLQFDFLPQNTGNEIKNWSHEKIVHSLEANFNLYLTHFFQYMSSHTLIRVPGFTLINSNSPNRDANYIIDTHLWGQDAQMKINENIQSFGQRNFPFTWWVGPNDTPPNLCEYLTKAGLTHSQTMIGMMIDLDAWDPSLSTTELKIIKAHDHASFGDITTLNKNYSGLTDVYTNEDPIEFYLGYVNNRPVIGYALVLYAQVAGIYSLNFLEHGFNEKAVIEIENFILHRAKEIGYHVAVLLAPEYKVTLYQDRGFKDLCLFKLYQYQPD